MCLKLDDFVSVSYISGYTNIAVTITTNSIYESMLKLMFVGLVARKITFVRMAKFVHFFLITITSDPQSVVIFFVTCFLLCFS